MGSWPWGFWDTATMALAAAALIFNGATTWRMRRADREHRTALQERPDD